MDYIPVVTPFLSESESKGQLIFDGTKIEVLFKLYKRRTLEGNRTDPTGRGINTIVLHWDVYVSSKQCFQTLCLRQLSNHLMIDTDGQVYQPLDIKYKSFHALSFNNRSISIQIANPVYVSKADSEIGRKIITSRQPGTFEHLDFTFEQKVKPLDNDGLISNAQIPDFTGDSLWPILQESFRNQPPYAVRF
ncbi:hypothetical protein Glove_126g21 [Diversispora epigaea]|uniref:N-acetylmuramoyl-L-alanine amidase domain-containing protein n=1 Tax=Diversispora epigaea TaxID=1348612 RepID=A0A397IYD0_9GLOM|nr:hypothetical protein Glove_126g21 [Diversispora epigaea]